MAPSLKALLSLSVPLWSLLFVLIALVTLAVLLYRQRTRPVETLQIIQDTGSSFWSEGRIGETPATQIVFDAHVTNISDKPAKILKAEIPRPFTSSVMALISNNHDARRPQVLSPNETAELRISFFVQPVVAKDAKPWRTTILVIDQYGNRHKIRNCEFRPILPNKPPEPKEPEEHPFTIADPIEREVVSVLKAELNRYSMCGRICGGLGSIHLVYKGHAFTGVGSEGWMANSPQNQMIVADPDAASLASDNLDALMGFYQSLESEEEKQRFVTVLLDRLAADKGYLAVSYFIVAGLWKLGFLPKALEKASRDLPENETRAFGLSNVLMLLNGLLRYRYPDFTNDMLDNIERMTHGMKEHTFLIPAKIQAIRTRRLTKTGPDRAPA